MPTTLSPGAQPQGDEVVTSEETQAPGESPLPVEVTNPPGLPGPAGAGDSAVEVGANEAAPVGSTEELKQDVSLAVEPLAGPAPGTLAVEDTQACLVVCPFHCLPPVVGCMCHPVS